MYRIFIIFVIFIINNISSIIFIIIITTATTTTTTTTTATTIGRDLVPSLGGEGENFADQNFSMTFLGKNVHFDA